MKIKRHQVIIAALIVLGVAFLAIGVFLKKEPIKYYAHSLRTWQESDSIAGYPIATAYDKDGGATEFITTEFQPNLSTMSPMERYRLPVAHGFSRPAKNEARAAGTGLVLYTGEPAGYPGKAVLLGHRLPDGSIVQTFYTGLTEIDVSVGQHLPRATLLGQEGHLHEIRMGSGIDIAKEEIEGVIMNAQDSPLPQNRITPEEFFAQHTLKHSAPDPLQIIQANELKKIQEAQGIGID